MTKEHTQDKKINTISYSAERHKLPFLTPQIMWTHQVKAIVELSGICILKHQSPLYCISQFGEPLPLRQSTPINNWSIILSHPPRMLKADHLITMCSAASTYSDIQEFKLINRNLSQVSASGK